MFLAKTNETRKTYLLNLFFVINRGGGGGVRGLNPLVKKRNDEQFCVDKKLSLPTLQTPQ